MKKRGQQVLGLSFGMIFSIFLIIFFIIIAFIAISSFLDVQKASNVGLFYQDLQESVDKAWKGQASEFSLEIDLPSTIEKICFANLTAEITGSQEDYQELRNYEVYEANTFLIPPQKAQNLAYKQIRHIDVEKITAIKNPYCIQTTQDITIKKDFYDKLVTIQ